MPVYEYQCVDCGTFEEMMPISQFQDPCDCPGCGVSAPRVLITMPRLAAVSSTLRRAHETNERSADTPKRSAHGPGCGCCGSSAKKPSKTLHHPNGTKSFPSKRPWMISH